jgi:ribulose-5-phosphate 4-epimerase/fuculose-1-phosphate aldolase
MATELEEIKLQVAQANRVLADVGLATGVTAALGHASMRVPSQPDRFVVKGREYALDALAVMRAEDMVVCDTEGFLVDAPPGITQCSEVKIHSCIYKTRPDVQSVVHVHPRFIVLMSVLRIPLVPMCQEGIHLGHHSLPVYPHVKTIQNDAEGMEVARLLGDGSALLLNTKTAHSPCLRVYSAHCSCGFFCAQRCRHCAPTSSQSKAATTFRPTNTGGCIGTKSPVSGSKARVVMPTAHSKTPTSSSSRLSHCWRCS